MNKELCQLRPMELADLPMVLEWRNAPHVRAASLNSAVITEAEHLTWFQCSLSDVSRRNMVFVYDGIPVGVVNLTRIDSARHQAYWGIYRGNVLKEFKGLGRAMGWIALDKCFQKLSLQTVFAEVLQTNPASLCYHESLGFSATGLPQAGLVTMSVTAAQWRQVSIEIAGQIFSHE